MATTRAVEDPDAATEAAAASRTVAFTYSDVSSIKFTLTSALSDFATLLFAGESFPLDPCTAPPVRALRERRRDRDGVPGDGADRLRVVVGRPLRLPPPSSTSARFSCHVLRWWSSSEIFVAVPDELRTNATCSEEADELPAEVGVVEGPVPQGALRFPEGPW